MPCTAQAEMVEPRPVGPAFVRDPGVGEDPLPPEQLAHQPGGCASVTPGLDQDLEHLALGIDGPPEIHLAAADPDEHLVEVPAAMRHRPSFAKAPGDHRPENHHPAPDRLVGDRDAALGQQVLDIPIAQGETKIHPDPRWMTSGGKR